MWGIFPRTSVEVFLKAHGPLGLCALAGVYDKRKGDREEVVKK